MIILPVNPSETQILPFGYTSTDSGELQENVASDLTYNGATPDSKNDSSVLIDTSASNPRPSEKRSVFALVFGSSGETQNVSGTLENFDTSLVLPMTSQSGGAKQAVVPLMFIAPSAWIESKLLRMRLDWQGGTPTLINIAYGNAYEFPCIENSQLSPAQFNKDVVYNNNISSKGHFLGRTAVRRGATVTLEPLSFIATVDRMNEILELFEKLETRACYVHYKVADKNFVHYGWTESEPNYQYTADEEYVQVSFTLRCPA